MLQKIGSSRSKNVNVDFTGEMSCKTKKYIYFATLYNTSVLTLVLLNCTSSACNSKFAGVTIIVYCVSSVKLEFTRYSDILYNWFNYTNHLLNWNDVTP